MKWVCILAVSTFSLATVGFADTSLNQKTHHDRRCNAKVVHTSSGAVGNPCLTTKEFVKSLDITPQQKKNWEYLLENKQLLGKQQERVSH
jgi:hypothetical protein